MLQILLLTKTLLVAGWFLLFAAAERAAPAARRPPGVQRLLNNAGLWATNTILSPLIIAPISLFAVYAAPWSRPDSLPFAAELALDILVLDIWIYAWHRLNHAWPFLWRFHAIHHRDEFLDATSAVRFHPGEVLLSACARAPIIALLAIPISSVLVFEGLVLAAAIFHHSNVRLPAGLERALRVLIVTPSHHWVHHHPPHGDTNSNYATLFTFWDRLFRSWSPTARTPDMAIGLVGAPDLPLLALAAQPLRSNQTLATETSKPAP